MLKWSQYSLVGAVILVVLSLAAYILVLMMRNATAPRRELVAAGAGGHWPAGSSGVGVAAPAGPVATPARPSGLVAYGGYFTRLALVFLTATLVLRAIATGHGPFANQYEFAISFGWGMLAVYAYFEYRYRVRMLALVVLPLAGALLFYALTLDPTAAPLVPALQDNFLLSVHVGTAILAYGAFSVACAAGVLYLLQPAGGRRGWPRPALLDELSYRSVVIAFPFQTIMIILGAVWADRAWGSYWSWDPKETAALVTWLIYGAYLHARVVRGWRGKRAAWLLMAGFAAVLFTFFGNLFFGGLHSYGPTNTPQ